MRRIAASIAAALLLLTAAPASAGYGEAGPGSQKYTVVASWNQAARELTGSETVSFTNNRTSPLSSVHLRLWPNGQSGCAKPFVSVRNLVGGTAGSLEAGCTSLPIALSAAIRPGETGRISFTFVDKVPKNWNFRYGISGHAAMLGNALPILAPTDDLGLHDEPYTINGESMYSSVASWHVALTIPAGTKAVTTGTVSSHSTLPSGRKQLVIEAPSERDFAMSIGRFQVSPATVRGIRIRYFKQPSNGTPAREVLAWAREAVNSFTEHYGAYNQPEIDLVEGTWRANGFEFPGMLMVDGSRDVVFHEIAHLWWYSMVGNNQWLSPWTDESFAEFSNRRLKGTNLNCDGGHPFAGVGGSLPLDSDMGTFDARGHYTGTVYQGGSCALEKLRREWGDARFDSFMSGLVTDFRNGIQGTCDVIGAIDAARPQGYDMEEFLAVARLSPARC
ncbi:MAG: hypothetical protein WD276_00100 [Actinomycetota bacterium]